MRPPRFAPLIVLGLAVVAVAVAVSFFAPWGNSSPVSSRDPRKFDSSQSQPQSQSPSSALASGNFDTSLTDDGTWVHVVGEVHEPGLYVVPVGSRVVDAIMAAGGLTEHADECALNLARPLGDGEQLVVPSRVSDATGCAVQVAPGAGGGGASVPVSLSRADLATLDSLPGIGPTLAQRIIDWRTANGGFTSVDQLNDVSGIGDKLFATLQPLVTP